MLWIPSLVLIVSFGVPQSVAPTVVQKDATPAPSSEPRGRRLALLVGCSDYQSENLRDLPGAANDVAAFQDLLTKQLRFDQVTSLVGWPAELAMRPTRDNIAEGFEQLIKHARPDSQVFILLSGHGTNFPVAQEDWLDPDNPEPDGLDEAFLPADYRPGENMILDNQLGTWLDALKAKGAHVMVVFDSCHSGTMTRSVSDGDEVPRFVTPEKAGVPLSKLQAVAARARNEPASRPPGQSRSKEPVDSFVAPTRVGGDATGSVVAFFAAHAHETAPELTRPRKTGIRRGLLSYHLEQALRDRTKGISYADLGRSLVARYQADDRVENTPMWTGALQREVLGFEEWPPPQPYFLHRDGARLMVSGGQLAGLTEGSILEVHSLDDKEYSSPLGQVRVTRSQLNLSVVEPMPGTDPTLLTDDSPCQIFQRNFGDARIRLSLQSRHGSELEELADKDLRAAISAEPESVPYTIVKAESDWTLIVDTSEAVLVQTQQLPLLLGADTKGAGIDIPLARMALEPRADLRKKLVAELERVSRWKNLFRLAVASAGSAQTEHVQLRVTKSDGRLITNGSLTLGDQVSLYLKNTSLSRDYWYVLAHLDGRYGVSLVGGDSGIGVGEIVHAPSVGEPVSQEVLRFRCNKNMQGTNCVLVLAIAREQHPFPPDYNFLCQEILGSPLSPRSRSAEKPSSQPKTEFEKLLVTTLKTDRAFRSHAGLGKPQVLFWSWVSPRNRD